MKLTDAEIAELNSLIIKRRYDLPDYKKTIIRHNNSYEWLRKNILVKNSEKVCSRTAELLNIKLPQKQSNS